MLSRLRGKTLSPLCFYFLESIMTTRKKVPYPDNTKKIPAVITTGNPSEIADSIFSRELPSANVIEVFNDNRLALLSHFLHQCEHIPFTDLYAGLFQHMVLPVPILGREPQLYHVYRLPKFHGYEEDDCTVELYGPVPYVKLKKDYHYGKFVKQPSFGFDGVINLYDVGEFSFKHRRLFPGFAPGFFYSCTLSVPLKNVFVEYILQHFKQG